jgi:hypothetical protein
VRPPEPSERDRQELAEVLAVLAALLAEFGESRWAAWIDRDRSLIARGDGFGIVHFLEAFGGMGSLADLVISSHGGHEVSADRIEAANRRLDRLRSRAYSLATDLRRAV